MLPRQSGRHPLRVAAAALCLVLLCACESEKPGARAGAAIDRAGTDAANAVGRAADETSAAFSRAGNWVRRQAN